MEIWIRIRFLEINGSPSLALTQLYIILKITILFSFYVGKRVAYVYKAKSKLKKAPGADKKSLRRVMWGTVKRTHGGTGTVRAKFTKNMCPTAMGNQVRIFLYPCKV